MRLNFFFFLKLPEDWTRNENSYIQIKDLMSSEVSEFYLNKARDTRVSLKIIIIAKYEIANLENFK